MPLLRAALDCGLSRRVTILPMSTTLSARVEVVPLAAACLATCDALGRPAPPSRFHAATSRCPTGELVVRLDRLDPTSRERCRSYAQRCERLWARLADGVVDGSGPYVAVRRPLVRVRQRAGGGDRYDLVDHARALARWPGLSQAAVALLARRPDMDELRVAVAPTAGRVWRRDGVTSVELPCEPAAFPPELGGGSPVREARRWVRMDARHARWRQRRSRRLVRLAVDAEEVWPDPRVAAGAR